MALQHLRSSTAHKRPVPGNMSDGQLGINTNLASPGLFFKDTNGDLVKVGPVHVGTTAPNASPASGGTAGNSVGEQWLDTTGGTYVFKVWDGSVWRSESGTFVDVNGDVMTGALGIIAGSNGSPGIYFSGDTNTGIYSPGADQVAISTGGSGRLFINSSGQVGVGTSPSYALHVSGTGTVSSRTFATDATGDASFFVQNDGNGICGPLVYGSTKTAYGALASNETALYSNRSTTIMADGASTVIKFATGGNTERLRITSTGTVNIVGAGSAGSTQAVSFNGSAPVDSLVLTSGGLLGIGTSSPSQTLSINGNGGTLAGTAAISFFDGNSLGSRRWSISNGAGGNAIDLIGKLVIGYGGTPTADPMTGTVAAVFDSSGRLGIGTTSPEAALDVFGIPNANYGNATLFDSTSTAVNVGGVLTLGGYKTAQTSRALFGFIKGGKENATSGNESGYLAFGTNNNSSNSEKVRIDSSGRLLVGTPSARTNFFNTVAGTQLQVEGTTYQSSSLSLVATGNNSYDAGTLVLGKGRGNAVGSNTIVQNGTPPDILGYISFQGNDGSEFVEGASIKAEVDGGVGANDLPSRLVFSTTADGAASPTERMRINKDGEVSIGSNMVSGTPLSVRDSSGGSAVIRCDSTTAQGTAWYLFYGTSDSGTTLQGWLRGDGTYGSRPNVYGGTSDAKLKENIVDSSSQWDDIKAIQVKKFNFIGDDLCQIGVIAQQVEEVSPGLVDENVDRDEDGNDLGTVTKSVKYSVLYMKAVKALQEAMERIEQLEQRLANAGIN